jgi:hypothetical protein
MEGSAAAGEEIRRRLELALEPAERPPAPDEVLEQVSRRGVLRGPVDWVFPAWIIYVEHAVQKIIETFPLTEEERRLLLHFGETLKQLLQEAWRQTKTKLAAIYKAVTEGTYKIEGRRLYAPDGTWMHVKNSIPRTPIRGVSAETYFPDILRLPRERLELLQLGWRASDEGSIETRPFMSTSQPWQLIAWAAARHGELYICIYAVNLTREGASIHMHIKAKGWRQRWGKGEVIGLVAEHFRRGEWAPLLTMWLGDGKTQRGKTLHGEYKLVIATKEPWKLGSAISAREALVAAGKEAYKKLRDAAGIYGTLLDLLGAHKWVAVKLATDEAFRAAYKLKTKRRSIDVLREMYGRSNGGVPAQQISRRQKSGQRRSSVVVIAGVEMSLRLVGGKSGSLVAARCTRDVKKALEIADKLETAGLRPNVVRSSKDYMVYIAMSDLLRLAERDEAIRRAVALYLAEKAKSGTQRHREIARKLLQRRPFLLPDLRACLTA